MQFGVPRDERRWKGKEKAAAVAVEVGAETIFEERCLPRSLTPTALLTPWNPPPSGDGVSVAQTAQNLHAYVKSALFWEKYLSSKPVD